MLVGERLEDSTLSGFVIATYREIADRFGLGSPDAARVRAKRSGWEREPANHPLDPARIRVPSTAWEQPTVLVRTPAHTPPRARSSSEEVNPNSTHPISPPGSDLLKSFSDALTALQGQLNRERLRADAAEARSLAAEGELRQARELLSHREGELDGLKLAAEHTHELLAQARRETTEAHNQAAEANHRAEDAARTARDVVDALERLKGRGLLARLLNRG
jgi:hypothetical protein